MYLLNNGKITIRDVETESHYRAVEIITPPKQFKTIQLLIQFYPTKNPLLERWDSQFAGIAGLS